MKHKMGPDGAPFASLHRVGVPCWHCYPVLLVLLLPLLVQQPANGLPITSKPLDNNPDHLTWEAAWLSEDSSRGAVPIGGKTKKITPKSIFITPFLNSYNTSACPPDFKVDYNGKCIQVVSINTADILVTKLQSLFAQHGQDTGGPGGAGGEDDYDYDYDATGPYQVNLPLSIDLSPEQPVPAGVSQGPKLTYQDNLGPSFYDSAMVDIATVEQDKAKITTVSVDGGVASDKPFLATTAATNAGSAGTTFSSSSTSSGSSTGSDQTGAESDISFLAFESLPNGTLAGQIELDGHNRTVVQSIFVSSTTTDTPATGDGGGSSTTQSATTTELDTEPGGTPTDRVGETVATDATVATGTSLGSTVPVTTTTTFDQEETYPIDREDASSTTQNVASSTEASTPIALHPFADADPEEALKLELAEESLLLENNHSSTVPVDLSTTDVSDMIDLDTVPTSETESSDEPTIVTGQEASTTKSSDNGALPASTNPTVQIITPIRGNWDLGFVAGSPVPAQLVAASYVQQDRTTRATPETTTVAIERWTEQPPKARNSSEVERLKAASEVYPIVAEGTTRFRYQLPTTTEVPATVSEASPAAPVSSTASGFALDIKPIPTTPPNNDRYMEQLRKINEIVAEKRRLQQQQEQQLAAASSSSTRIRFPSRDDEPLRGAESVSNYQQATSAGVRFPGTATNRLTPSGNRLPDIFPKKSADSTTQRPAFWWLPSGWEVDQTGNKPMLLRFWSRMPLVRDSSTPPATGSESQTDHLSSNSNRWRSSSSFQQPQHYQQQQQQQQQQFSNHLPVATSGGASHPVASARGNSKSPSENFYKEVSAQEVYKVMNARQLNHHKR